MLSLTFHFGPASAVFSLVLILSVPEESAAVASTSGMYESRGSN
jgi:hypothetical protein